MRTLQEIKDSIADESMKNWYEPNSGWEYYSSVLLDLGKYELLDIQHDEACQIYAEEFAKEFGDFATSHIDDVNESMERFKVYLEEESRKQ